MVEGLSKATPQRSTSLFHFYNITRTRTLSGQRISKHGGDSKYRHTPLSQERCARILVSSWQLRVASRNLTGMIFAQEVILESEGAKFAAPAPFANVFDRT